MTHRIDPQIDPLLSRINQLVLKRWNVTLTFLDVSEANELYGFPFECKPQLAMHFHTKHPKSLTIVPIYNQNLLFGAIQIPTDLLNHDDLLEISELSISMIKQHLSLTEELSGTQRVLNQLELENEVLFKYGTLITRNKTLYRTWEILDEHSDSKTPILICGEKGTGKKSLALSFIEKNNIKDCSFCNSVIDLLAIKNPDETIIFPITDSLTPQLQEELSTFLFLQKSNPTIGPRIIALAEYSYATIKNDKKIKLNLLQKLNQVVISIPPLKDRMEDLFLLINERLSSIRHPEHLHQSEHPRHPERSEGSPLSINNLTPQTISLLCEYNWPGNIKELFEVLDDLVLKSKSDKLTADLLPSSILGKGKREAIKMARETNNLEDALSVLEKELIRENLIKTNWNKSLVSKELGISRSGLINKVEKYNLRP